MDLAELNLKVNTRDVRRAIVDLDRLEKKAGRVSGAMGFFEKAMFAAAGGVAALGAASVREYAHFEQAAIGLESLIGNADEAKQIIEELRETARTSIFNLNDLTRNVSVMKALGVETKQLIPQMRALADASAAFGGREAQATLNRFILNFAEIRAQGRLDAEDIRRLTENRLPVLRILSEELGYQQGQIRKLAEEGKLLADDVIPALFRGIQKNTGGFIQVLSGTLMGQFTVLMNNIRDVAIDIGEAIDNSLNLRGIVKGAIDFINASKGTITSAIRLIGDVATEQDRANDTAVKWAKTVLRLTGLLAAMVGIKIVGWLGAIAKGIKAVSLAIATNPFLLLATAAAFATAAIAENWRELVTLGDEVVQVGDIVIAVWGMIYDRIKFVAMFIATIWKNAVWPRMKEFWENALDVVAEYWDKVSSAFMEGVNFVLGIVKGWINILIAYYKSLYDTVAYVLKRIADKFGFVWGLIVRGAKKAFISVLESFKEFLSAMTFGANIIVTRVGQIIDEMTNSLGANAISIFLKTELAKIDDASGNFFSDIATIWKENFSRDFVGEVLNAALAALEKLALTLKTGLEEAYAFALQDPEFAAFVEEFNKRTGGSLFEELQRRAATVREARGNREAPDTVRKPEPIPGLGEGSGKAPFVLDEDVAKFLQELDDGVRNAFVDGLTDAILEGDWRDAFQNALADLSRTALSSTLNQVYSLLVGAGDGKGGPITALATSLFSTGASAAAGGAGAGAEGAAPVTGAQKSMVLVSVMDDATADMTAKKMSTSGAEVAVLKGTGSPGVSAGRIRSGKR